LVFMHFFFFLVLVFNYYYFLILLRVCFVIGENINNFW
jgi:hypothetical protein